MRCMTKECKGIGSPICRDLCMACYKVAKGSVESGVTSWEELGRMGMCKQSPSEASSSNLFAKEFSKRKEQGSAGSEQAEGPNTATRDH